MESGLIRAAAAVPAVSVGNMRKNKDNIYAMIAAADKENVSVAAFPELCITSYTLGDLFLQAHVRKQSEIMLKELLEQTENTNVLAIIGVPVYTGGKLYNAAVAIQSGQILAIVPKISALTNRERRWFASSVDSPCRDIRIFDKRVPFGPDILLECPNGFVIGINIGEDLWSPLPRCAYQALAGATICVNIAASNEQIGKAKRRQEFIKHISGQLNSGFIYVSAGPGESTTDTVYGGHSIIAENGELLSSSSRFEFESYISITELDIDRLVHDRLRKNAFKHKQTREFTRVAFDCRQVEPKFRSINSMPFVPDNAHKRDLICQEAFDIQVAALTKRILHTGQKRMFVGVSGGLDSALALMVSCEAAKKAGLCESAVSGVVMPGLGSTDTTQELAKQLITALGAKLIEINIVNATKAHLADIGHNGLADITFENAQARERTQILMDLANKEHGLVIGTGDLSELALGFCTYAGDQISMYGVNSGIAKTLVRAMVVYLSKDKKELNEIICNIVNIPPSPELRPPNRQGARQDTQQLIGPYDLNDFFIYYAIRFQMPPHKIVLLAKHAFDKYSESYIKEQLKMFYKRFFSSQFKRSCMPDGPKVGSVCFSPREEWKMPSDADVQTWLSDL